MMRVLFAAAWLTADTMVVRGGEVGGVTVELQQADGIPPYATGDSFVDVIVTSPLPTRGGVLTLDYDPENTLDGLPEPVGGVDYLGPYESGGLYVLEGICPSQEGKRTFQMYWLNGSDGAYLPPGRKNPVTIRFYTMRSGSCSSLTFREDCRNLVHLADGTSVTPTLKSGKGCYMSRISTQLPGDCNNDRLLNLADAICLFGFIFTGNPARLPCGDGSSTGTGNLPLLDFNGDERLDIGDGVALLQYQFLGGPPHSQGTRCRVIDGCPTRCD
jgi:hypothetical protein